MDFSYYEMDIFVKHLNANNYQDFRENIPSTNCQIACRFIKNNSK